MSGFDVREKFGACLTVGGALELGSQERVLVCVPRGLIGPAVCRSAKQNSLISSKTNPKLRAISSGTR